MGGKGGDEERSLHATRCLACMALHASHCMHIAHASCMRGVRLRAGCAHLVSLRPPSPLRYTQAEVRLRSDRVAQTTILRLVD